MQTEKPKDMRVKEIVEILKKITSLGIPLDSPDVQELKQHFDKYIKEGECWSGTVPFLSYGRIAVVNLPKKADKTVEVTLKVPDKH
jgi:hypothetical protein